MDFDQYDDDFPPRDDLNANAAVVLVDQRDQRAVPLEDAIRAIIAHTLAQRSGGKSILHVDDTDPEPLREGNPQQILNMLSWLDVAPDEHDTLGQHGPYSRKARRRIDHKDRQVDIYQEVVNYLIEEGWAYLCFCHAEPNSNPPLFFEDTRGHKSQCRDLPPDELKSRLCLGERCLIRFRVSHQYPIVYDDPVFGCQSFERESIEDFVLLTPDGMPMPYLAHVVDNHFMRVTTHVRRSSALEMLPQEFLLSQALGWDLPTLIHVPPVYDPAAGVFSEEPCLDTFMQQGYDSGAMRNFLTKLIWTHPQGKLIYPHEDFQRGFEIQDLPCEPRVVDYELLNRIQEGYTMT